MSANTLLLLNELSQYWTTTITTEEDGSATVSIASRLEEGTVHVCKRASLGAAIAAAWAGEDDNDRAVTNTRRA